MTSKQSTELNKIFIIGDLVIVDNNFTCEIIDIVFEDGVTWYEVEPLAFNSFARFVTIDDLSEVVEDEL